MTISLIISILTVTARVRKNTRGNNVCSTSTGFALICLNSYEGQIPTRVAEDDAQWFNFLKYYAMVIEDGSLVYKADDLRMIREVIFRKETNGLDSSEGFPFNIIWDITLKDDRQLSWLLTPGWKLLGTLIVEGPAS